MVRKTSTLALAGSFLMLAACEEDQTSKAIREAHVRLTSLTNVSDQHTQQTLSALVRDLRSAASDGTDAQRAAAQLIIARAEFGLAAEPADQVASIEANASNMLNEVRSLYEQYLTIRSLADANASYNPGEDLAELDEQIDIKDREVAQARADKAEIDQRVQELRDQAARLREQAGQLRVQERQMRDAVLASEDPSVGAELMVETQRVRREADAFDVDASKLDARADQIAPEATLAQGEIDMLLRQQKLLSDARAETVQRGEDSRRMAEELSARAAAAARSLTSKAEELEALRTDSLAPQVEQAVSAYEKARSAASQARTQLRKAAGAIVAESQQAIGDVASTHAIGLRAYSETLAAIARSDVDGAETLAANAERAHEARKRWLERAAEAYTGAADAYGGNAEEGLGAELSDAAERLRGMAAENPPG